MKHLCSWGGVALALVAVALDASTWSSPRASLVLAVAAVVGKSISQAADPTFG